MTNELVEKKGTGCGIAAFVLSLAGFIPFLGLLCWFIGIICMICSYAGGEKSGLNVAATVILALQFVIFLL